MEVASAVELVKCGVCLTAKSIKTCGLCQVHVCKKCLETPAGDAFLYLKKIPVELNHTCYCIHCWDAKVVPALADYELMAEKARNVYFLTEDYRGYVRVLRKHTKRVDIEDCDDRREIILKMAYMAAELGFNAIIQSRVESASVYINSYHSSRWKASALPAIIDGEQLERSSLLRI